MTIDDVVKRYRLTRRAALEELAQAALDAGILPKAELRENATERVARALMTEMRVFTAKELAARAGLSVAATNAALQALDAAKRIAVSYRAFKSEAPSAGPRPMLYGAAHNHPDNAPYKPWVQCTSLNNECLGGCLTAAEHARYNR